MVVVTYNSESLIEDCLDAIETAIGPDDVICVVDNASVDSTVRRLTERTTPPVVVEPGDNLGFGRACNLAATTVDSDWILLLNPDTVATPTTVSALVEGAARHPAAGIYGGRTVHTDGALDPRSCWAAPTLWSIAMATSGLTTILPRHPMTNPEMMPRWDRGADAPVDIVTGCLLLASRTAWERLGGFDERYFLYGEDADLCLRARQAGFQPHMIADAVITHFVGKSSTKAVKLQFSLKGRVTLVRTHFSGPKRAVAVLLTFLMVWARGAVVPRVRRSHRDGAWAQAWATRRDWGSGYT